MVKIIIFSTLLIFANANSYEKNCIPCHQNLPVSLQYIFMKYLLIYGGERNMKAGIEYFLKYPLKDNSRMSKLFIDNYGIKDKTNLDEKSLKEAINIYWEKYKIFEKLK